MLLLWLIWDITTLHEKSCCELQSVQYWSITVAHRNCSGALTDAKMHYFYYKQFKWNRLELLIWVRFYFIYCWYTWKSWVLASLKKMQFLTHSTLQIIKSLRRLENKPYTTASSTNSLCTWVFVPLALLHHVCTTCFLHTLSSIFLTFFLFRKQFWISVLLEGL